MRRIWPVTAAAALLAGLMVFAVPGLSFGGGVGASSVGVPGREAGPATSQPLSAPGSTAGSTAAGSTHTDAGLQPAASSPYTPPLHGTNPHATGTAAVVQLSPNPSGGGPLPLNPTGTETVIVGRSIGEQRSDGSYHGHITILAALGNEILGEDTTAGQSVSGPLNALQTGILNGICNSLGICVSAVVANSTTTATSTTNHFEAADVALGAAGGTAVVGTSVAGVPAIDLGAVSSDGNIATQGPCQVASADSSVAQLSLAGVAAAQILQSTSNTTTCGPGGTSVAPAATSKVIALNSNGISLPPIVPAGCADGTPNTDGGIPAILPIYCNADDTSGSQTTIPYNVREALTIFVATLAKVTAGASETAAAAPTTGTTSTGTTSTGTTSTGTTSTGTTSTGTTSTGTTSTGTTSTGTTSTGTTSTGTTSTGTTSTGTTSTGTTSTGTTSTGTTSTGTTSTGTTSTGTTSTGTTSTGTTSTGTTSTGTAPTSSGASLPFTGYDMTGAVLFGVLLLGAGVGLRKMLSGGGRRAGRRRG
jgi:mucin-2